MKKAILIDSKNKTIKEVKVSTIKDILPYGGFDIFECYGLPDDEGLFADDEAGAFNEKASGFRYNIFNNNYPLKIAGNAVIIGLDSDAKIKGTKLTIEEVSKKILFN